MFSDDWTDREIMYIGYVGKLFLRMLKALILPLIIPSLIAAIGQLDMSLSGKVGGRAVAYYMITTVLAVILGIILVTSIQPGYSAKVDQNTGEVIMLRYYPHTPMKHQIKDSRVIFAKHKSYLLYI